MKTVLAVIIASMLVTACGHTRGYVGVQEYFDHVKENGQ